ncbi:MAG: glycosyltransferase family 1 protein [Patescibacteria group bacterium]|nr:glycosyltransferase family 1 protein [Patescibacteria group bacterium]
MLIGLDASRANRRFKSGTEWYAYYLIKELAKIDSTNQYLLYSDKPLTGGLADLAGANPDNGREITVKRGCQIIKSPHHNFKAKILAWPFSYLWTQVRLSLEMLVEPPDALFIPAHTLPLIHPKKSVVTIHDVGFERAKELYGSDNLGPSGGWIGKIFGLFIKLFTGGKFRANKLDYHSWSTKFALEHAKKIIAVSEFTKQEMIDIYGASGEKIEVVHNGFNSELYKKISDKNEIEKTLKKYGIKAPYIFYVGRLEKKKNTARLVNAFAIMKEKYKTNHKLVLVGNADLGFDEVKYVIEEFDLQNDVIITGWVPELDIPYLYGGAALFVFPSLYEGFGIPLVQAMASGVPVTASDIPSIRETTAGAAWLFNPLDKRDIAEKMAKVLSDKKLAADLIAKGHARASDFSLLKCAQETLAVIKKM